MTRVAVIQMTSGAEVESNLAAARNLLERARAAGAQAWGGLGMLVRQAAASFTIWTGHDPPLELMSAVALHGLRSRATQQQ